MTPRCFPTIGWITCCFMRGRGLWGQGGRCCCFPLDAGGLAGGSGVTAACLMIEKKRFEAVGGFNELFRSHYEDVDLNLRLLQKGLRNICVAGTRLIHHESKTRKANYDYNDRILLLDYWEDQIERGDRFYNP